MGTLQSSTKSAHVANQDDSLQDPLRERLNPCKTFSVNALDSSGFSGIGNSASNVSVTPMLDESASPLSNVVLRLQQLKKTLRESWERDLDEPGNSLVAHRDLPRITMESLSATGANFLLLLTYASCIAAIILYFELDVGSNQVLQLYSGKCGVNATLETTASGAGTTQACTQYSRSSENVSATWSANIKSIVNLIGDIELFVCFEPDNWRNSSLQTLSYDVNVKGWTYQNTGKSAPQSVLSQYLTQNVEFHSDDLYCASLFRTFQNQEVLQNNGDIEGYQIQILYKNGFGFMRMLMPSFYEFHYYSALNPLSNQIMRCILCIVTVVVAFVWFRTLVKDENNPQKWLRERKWLSFFLLGLLCYQNPVYCVAQWYVINHQVHPWIAYMSSLVSIFGQVTIFTVFLLLSDGIVRATTWSFYFPKLAFGLTMIVVHIVLETLKFPSLYSTSSPLLSVTNWNQTQVCSFVTFATALLLLKTYWICMFILSIFATGYRLKNIEYIKARYKHLSYRLLVFQAVPLCLIFILEYVLDLQHAFNVRSFMFTNDKIVAGFNSLQNGQHESISWTLFISVYIYTAIYLYAPLGTSQLHFFLTRSFALREEDLNAAKEIRQADMSQLRKIGILVPSFVEQKPIFCVEMAKWMVELSIQAYYDPPRHLKDLPENCHTLGPINLDKFGFELLMFLWDQKHDTNCFIIRHKVKDWLVVVFRGSMSAEHWKNNLQVNMRAIDTHTLCPRGEENSQPKILNEDFDLININTDTANGTFLERLRNTMSKAMSRVRKAGQAGVEFAGESLETAAEVTRIDRIPVLKHTLVGHVHSGFWSAYCGVREDLHRYLRRYLKIKEYQIFFTGHSQGGALASLAAMDFMLHSAEKIKRLWASRRGQNTGTDFSDMCKVTMYNFGSPRVGNPVFRNAYNELVPNSFRIVVDGDIVPALPPNLFYQHLGTEVILEPEGGKNIIVDPSTAEKKFQVRPRLNIYYHDLHPHYLRSLCSCLNVQPYSEAADGETITTIPDIDPVSYESVSYLNRLSTSKVFSRISNLFSRRQAEDALEATFDPALDT